MRSRQRFLVVLLAATGLSAMVGSAFADPIASDSNLLSGLAVTGSQGGDLSSLTDGQYTWNPYTAADNTDMVSSPIHPAWGDIYSRLTVVANGVSLASGQGINLINVFAGDQVNAAVRNPGYIEVRSSTSATAALADWSTATLVGSLGSAGVTAPLTTDTCTLAYPAGPYSYPYGAGWASFSVPTTGNDVKSLLFEFIGTTNAGQTIMEIQAFSGAVPEPSGIVLLACGLLSLLAYTWQKRN